MIGKQVGTSDGCTKAEATHSSISVRAGQNPENPHPGKRNHVGMRKQLCLTLLARTASPLFACAEHLALASVAMAAKDGLPESVTNSHGNSDELRLNILGRNVVIARFRVNSVRTFANP